MDVQEKKVLEALANKECGYYYETTASNFSKIPGSPIAYWMSQRAVDNFEQMRTIGDYGCGRIGLVTGDAGRFLRLWYEVSTENIGFNIKTNEESIKSRKKWFPDHKGGDYRKWYGNMEYVVNWYNDGFDSGIVYVYQVENKIKIDFTEIE
jgi:hypothetical protein